MNDLIIKLAVGESITDTDISNELSEICDREHGSCNSECPVYELNDDSIPDSANDFKINRGCDTYGNGKAMLRFIRLYIESS